MVLGNSLEPRSSNMEKIIFKIASTKREIQAAREIRTQVFIREQGIPQEMDLDDDEEQSMHLLAITTGFDPIVVGTGRLTVRGETGILSRIAVIETYRSQGIGKLILLELEKIAMEKKLHSLSLTPHSYLENFYASLGYIKMDGEKVVGKYNLLYMEKMI
jgi:predicted GNAT family N-acyltransferase